MHEGDKFTQPSVRLSAEYGAAPPLLKSFYGSAVPIVCGVCAALEMSSLPLAQNARGWSVERSREHALLSQLEVRTHIFIFKFTKGEDRTIENNALLIDFYSKHIQFQVFLLI